MIEDVDLQSMKEFQLKIKYVLDRLAALLLFILLFPLIAVLYILVRLDSQGPGFYMQCRVGKDGKDFNIYKFRTMVVNAEHIGSGILVEGEDDPRITRFGKFLRKTSLDELPQIFNILKGDMSFIGPRPTLRYQVEKYSAFQRQRLNMKPGITGWAQVHGRNAISWPARIEYDVWYVNNYSLMLDLLIMFKTVSVVFKPDAVYGGGDEISRQ